MSEESKVKTISGSMLFIICFLIGCIFLYWAVEYWVYNTFDANRYELSKIQVGNNDSLSVWKLDRRTGWLEYCTKSYDKMDHFYCVHASNLEAKEYSETPEPVKTPPMSPESAATSPAESTVNNATETMQKTATGPMAKSSPQDSQGSAPATNNADNQNKQQTASGHNESPPTDNNKKK